jgi:peptide-methionine (S)-S-oxide reductase
MVFVGLIALALTARALAQANVSLPMPSVDMAANSATGPQTAVFAGGCFWGVQSVFQHVRGVQRATSGYAGGKKAGANYESVSSGDTGHAESVEVVYDPQQVSYGQLLRIFFSVAHDPTQVNRQGPDFGSQYRSAIFYVSPEQQRIAAAYIGQLQSSKQFAAPIATQLAPLQGFYAAEDYHQNYADRHPNELYIVLNDRPKVANLKRRFPELYVAR